MSTFKVGLTRDFMTPDGQLTYEDIGLDILSTAPGIEHEFLARHEPTIQPDQLEGYDAIISLTPRYSTESLQNADGLVGIVRFGVGYDMVDVDACTNADVLLCITAGAVNHSVAESIVAWMLALSHNMMTKDRLVRQGQWAERSRYMGRELRDRTLGIVGLGGIGGRLIEVLHGFGMKDIVAFDPFTTPQRAAELGARLAPLDEVLRVSDFVSINCPLTPETRDLIGAEQLALMREDSYLINTARGGIVNEPALIEALKQGKIAGAGIDVFDSEPVGDGHPLAELDNVILAPHCIAWTDELFRDIGRMSCQIAVDLSQGKVPPGVVNKAVLDRPGFQAKLARYR